MLTTEDYEKLNAFYEENQVFRELFQSIEKDHMLSLSKISHEIRNPVTLINGFLQLMVTDHPEITTWRYWSDVMENMVFLRELLTELSQYNNAGLLRKTEASPYQLLHSVITSSAPAFTEKNINIRLDKSTPIPPFMVDTTKLREVFLNLFRNAAEAMPQGGTLTCRISCDGEAVTIIISDTGCGISEEDLPGIFDAFVTHKKDGSGLGLAIARQVMEAHQGTIHASSREGEGSTFTLVLPILY